MSANSKIEWTDHTFNPWIGCTKVSPACDHCYAERSTPSRTLGVEWGPHAERRRTSAGNWAMPKRWNDQAGAFMAQHGRRQRVFCASLADVFDNAVEREWRDDLATLILDTPNLDWLLLTKRIGNAAEMLGEMFLDGPPDNIRVGATICNQPEANRDILKLLALGLPNFVSVEPMLAEIDLTDIDDGAAHREVPRELWTSLDDDDSPPSLGLNALTGERWVRFGDSYDRIKRIDWVIVGGESGPGARPMHPDWARSLRDQCAAAGVPFLYKQWGEWKPISQMPEPEHDALYRSRVKARPHEDQGALDDLCGRDCTVPYGVVHTDGSLHEPLEPNAFIAGAMTVFKVGKKAAGRLLDGREWNEVPAC